MENLEIKHISNRIVYHNNYNHVYVFENYIKFKTPLSH